MRGALLELPAAPSTDYSPGVAYACEEIVRDPNTAAEMTSRGNLVGVITNGSAVLGLGSLMVAGCGGLLKMLTD